MEQKSFFARWRSSFLTGLAVTFPALLTLAAVKWLFGTISSVTDLLLFFLPRTLTHESLVNANDGKGPMFWYWSLVALVLAVVLISVAGVLARYYIGKKMIDWTDRVLMRVPLLNKFYGAIKQVNDAFAGNKHSFKTVVLVEFPGPGNYSVGFITSEQQGEVQQKTGKKSCQCLCPHHAQSHLRLSDSGAGGKTHQTRHVRHRRHQIHRQPRLDFAGILAADDRKNRPRIDTIEDGE